MKKLGIDAIALTLFLCATPLLALAQADLVVTEDDIEIDKYGGQTHVTVTVHNNGTIGSGEFTLRIGASKNGITSSDDFTIAGLPAGGFAVRTKNFNGTDWNCGWGMADALGDVSEQSESNNYASQNVHWISVNPDILHSETIGVCNPSISPETVAFSTSAPAGWLVTVDPPMMALAAAEHRDVVVYMDAPPDVAGMEMIEVFGEFQDYTPGTMHWIFLVEEVIDRDAVTWGRIKSLFR